MRQDRFTLDNLMEYIYNQQIAQIPAKMYNDDAQVKYLEFGSLYTYCCHGNKEHQIRRWLRERIAYVDSMLGYFTSQDDQVTIRMNKSGPVSFSVTTYIPLYFSVKWSNATGGTQTIKMKRGETKEFSYNSTTSTDQEVIIYHAQYIKDLNNLSNLNPSSCILANALKLTNVEIHSSKLYNINVTNNKYLRNINLRNCTALGTVTATGSSLDLSKCKYLQHCDIYKTNLTEVQLGSEGGSLLDIFYPKSVQTIQLIKQRLLHTIGLPYGNNGDEIPTSLYTVTIQECPNITKLNTSTNAAINSSFVSMSYCNNLTIRNSLDLEELNFDGFHRLKNVVVENMYNLTSVGFNDLLPKGETSTIQYIGMSNCPKLETLELNCTSNDYEITFADKAVLNLGGLFGLKSITSNCVLKGIDTIVVPTKLESMFFTNEYGEGYSSIKNIWVSSVCDVNTSGSTAKVTYIGDGNYSGIDFNGMNLKNIDLGALVNIPNAINFNIAPTTVNPHFNLNRDGETYPYLQPEGSIDLTNYTESLARFFDGIDLDKLQIICKGSMPQTDLSYCFYNATFSKLQSITTLLNKVANIINLDYCFYKTTINNTSVISSIKMGTNSTMNYTFAECPNITTLNNITIPKNVVAVEGMFYKCPLTSINSMIVNVQGSIKGLFKGCENLTSITTLLIPNVTDVESTFEGCINLETLTGFNLPTTCTNVSNLFKGCYKLTRLTGLNLGSTISKGDNWCPPNLTTVENCTINTDKAKFKNVVSLTTVQDTNITGDDLSDLFNGCIKLGTLKNCSITANRSLARAFKNCNLITQSPITVIKDSVINIDEIFSGCTGITDISGMTFGSGITNTTNWIPPKLTTANNVTIKNNVVKFENSTLTTCNNLTITSSVNSLVRLFYYCTSLNSITFNPNSNFTNVTTMKETFRYTSISSLDLSNVTVSSKLTSLETCFGNCNKLTEITMFNNMEEASLSNISELFISNDGNLTTLRNFKLGSNCSIPLRCRYTFKYPTGQGTKISNTDGMYINCDCLRLRDDDTGSIRQSNGSSSNLLYSLFAGCDAFVKFTDLELGPNVTDISNGFRDIKGLTEDVILPSHITKCENTFKDCTSMTHIHSNWNNTYTKGITPTDCYAGCLNITHIDDIQVTFYEGDLGLDYIPEDWGGNGFGKSSWSIQIDASVLSGGVLTLPETAIKVNWGDGNFESNTNTHTYTDTTRRYNVKFKTVEYIANNSKNYDKCNLGNMSWLTKVYQIPAKKGGANRGLSFRWCSNLEYVNFSNVEMARSINSLLDGCKKLTTENIIGLENAFKANYNCPSDFEFGVDTNWTGMFTNCIGLTSLDLSNVGIYSKKCTNVSTFFHNCTSLKTVDLSGWDTRNINKVVGMFYGCSSLNSLDMSHFNISNVTDLSDMFNGCSSLSYLNITGWDFKNVTTVASMFSNVGLKTIDTSTWLNANNITNFANFCNVATTEYITLTFSGSMWAVMHNCKNVKHVTWKNCTVSIENYSFPSFGDARKAEWQITFDNAIISAENGTLGVLSYYNHLTVESLMSVINALADRTGMDSDTLTLGSAHLAKLTPEQIKIATDKNWTVV